MKKILKILLCTSIFFIGTYCVFASQKNNTNTVYFDNIKVLKGNGIVEYNNKEKTSLIFNSNLNIPGDEFGFTIDVINNTNETMYLKELNKTILTDSQSKYLSLIITYQDGNSIKINDSIKSNEKNTLKVLIKYRNDLTAEDLPKTSELLNLYVDINYESFE